jgi:alcohol dehydrogenase, propanol-preferring
MGGNKYEQNPWIDIYAMRAMILPRIVSLDEVDKPLQLVDIPVPIPVSDEVLIKVSACGVCHTELDEIEGRASPANLPVVPGHEVIGTVEKLGSKVSGLKKGQRVGVGWIHRSTGAEDENLSPEFRATGRDVNGGYAEYMTVPEEYSYPIPDIFSDVQAAPLLCAGAIGYRAVRLANLEDGGRLGLSGFGGSAHLVLQLVRHKYPGSKVYVFAREQASGEFARELGAVWAGDTTERSPEMLDAIIDTTPAWKPVVEALSNLRPGGRLVINAIRKEDIDKDYLLNLDYQKHLWMEKEIKTVANITRQDIEEFLLLAANIPIKAQVTSYGLEQANEALMELKHGTVKGAKVLTMSAL